MRSKRLVFIVEGDCELAFIEKMVIPYLYQNTDCNGWSMNAQKITTSRKLNKKGGNINYAYLKNEIERVLAQGNVWITTFLDFFRLPNDFPAYDSDGRKIDDIEKAIRQDIGSENVFPYIQKYEFETLLFSSISGFELLLDDKDDLHQIENIIEEYPNVEDINGGAETAPSKRLLSIFNYDKTTDSDLILSELSIDRIMEKCPRFNQWMKNVIELVSARL